MQNPVERDASSNMLEGLISRGNVRTADAS
jgi:hypothetical protein